MIENFFYFFVNALIPRTPKLAEKYGAVQYYGAVDQYTDQFLVMLLNHYYIPMAEMTARVMQRYGNATGNRNDHFLSDLSEGELIDALQYLERNMDELVQAKTPFQNDRWLIPEILYNLNRYTMFGYYSEWFGYGTTRAEPPGRRILEFYPLSWEQTGYPGPSLGYRALRAYEI